MVTPIEGDIPACVAWELTGPESGQSLEDANWITKVSNIMELIFWSQYSLPDKTKIGTQWGIDTEAPHLRSSSLTQACPPGDLWGCVFDELVCEKTSASFHFLQRKVKEIGNWQECGPLLGTSAKRKARILSAHHPLAPAHASQAPSKPRGCWECCISVCQNPTDFPRPSSGLCSRSPSPRHLTLPLSLWSETQGSQE